MREKIKFAFIPIKIENKWIWLQRYTAIYSYEFTHWNEYITYGVLLQNQLEIRKSGYKWLIKSKKLINKSVIKN